jgi:cytochrome P450
MVLHPEVQARARRDLDRLLQGRLPDFSDERSLPYITAIVKEVLRWNPAVPMGMCYLLFAIRHIYLKAAVSIPS